MALRSEADVGFTMNTIRYGDRNLRFIEVPALDSGVRLEEQVFEEWVSWLVRAYKLGIKINGLIYVHNILDPRFTGTARRGLEIFKRLCGHENYKAICMTTTGWERIDVSKGNDRLQELSMASEFWGDVRDFGGSISKLFNNRKSAMTIVDHVLRDKKKYILAIQREMVDEKKQLHETEAGKVLHEAWLRKIGRFESERQALPETHQVSISSGAFGSGVPADVANDGPKEVSQTSCIVM